MISPILIAGRWRQASAAGTFRSENPTTREPLADEFPISSWQDCDEALSAAAAAFQEMRRLSGQQIGDFLENFAQRIDARKDELVKVAHMETALPVTPRLADGELPRTTGQLRQAAAAVRDGSWAMPTIDTKQNIRSVLEPLGPVAVFGPNNFPFAFNSVSGGDFAAAIAAGNPVIAKTNTSHPATSRLLAEEAHAAAQASGMPESTVQLIYRTSHADGEKLVSDGRLAATGYTGSRSAGLKLKGAAERAGKLFYAELSSINPVVILPGALDERLEDIAGQFATSCLMGTGQFCTNPGLVILLAGPQTDKFIAAIVEKFKAAPAGTLLSAGVAKSLAEGIDTLARSGAEVLVGRGGTAGNGYSHPNTLLRTTDEQFLAHSHALQTEAFGNESLLVVCSGLDQAAAVIEQLEGNLTGCIYSDTTGSDDAAYDRLAAVLRHKVGRLLNDKMPTGVAVSPAMNHGGPFPATSHPGFTSVGIPAALRRFAMLSCYDAVREHRLPPPLRNKNPTGKLWRSIDGRWTTGDVG